MVKDLIKEINKILKWINKKLLKVFKMIDKWCHNTVHCLFRKVSLRKINYYTDFRTISERNL